jgi:hypothetical protein
MKFVKLRKYIESKRDTRNRFFDLILLLKDKVYDFATNYLSKFIFGIYNSLIIRPKYDILFVVSRYKEDINWLKKISYKYVLYNKGPSDIVNNINYKQLPNVGREAHTFLTYIVDNYDSLPDFVGFLQGDPFPHSIFMGHRLSKFKGEDFYPLSPNTKYQEEARAYIDLIENSTAKYFGIVRPAGEFPFGAQFIVSRDKILKHSLKEYEFLLKKIIDAEDNRRQCLVFKKHPQPCACANNDISAWVMEVWWPILFKEDKNIIKFD